MGRYYDCPMMNSNRATHHGTCQLCGHFQLLPGGRLSTHGYAVLWSQFVGTCPGSKGLPFQTSTDLIEAAIADHLGAASRLRSIAADLRANETTVGTIPLRVYVPATWTVRKSSYRWIEVEVVAEDRGTHTRFTASYETVETSGGKRTKTDDLRQALGIPYSVEMNLANVYRAARERRAEAFEAEAKGHEKYAAWQRERIANWTPTELTPRKAKA